MRSVCEYAAEVWAHSLSATTTSKLERVQLEAARSIIGLVHPSKNSSREFYLPSITTRFQAIFLVEANERAHHPEADDRRQTLVTTCRQRLKRKNWRNTQLLYARQVKLSLQALSLTPSSSELRSIPMGLAISHLNDHHTSRQENVIISVERPFATNL